MLQAPSRYARTIRTIVPFAAICGLCYLFLITFVPERFGPTTTISPKKQDIKKAPNSGTNRILIGGIQDQIMATDDSYKSNSIKKGAVYADESLSGTNGNLLYKEDSFGIVASGEEFSDKAKFGSHNHFLINEANDNEFPRGSIEKDEQVESRSKEEGWTVLDNTIGKEYRDGLEEGDDLYDDNITSDSIVDTSQRLPLINQEESVEEQIVYRVEKASGVLLMLIDEDQLQDTRETIRQVEDRFNRGRDYPWVILSPFSLTTRSQKLIRQLSKGDVNFGTIPHDQWRLPKWIDASRVRNNDYAKLKQGMNKTSLITRHKWRYMSGFVAEHELLDPYEFIWRIDPGVEIFCDIEEDPMLELKRSGQQFAWSLSSTIINEAGISGGSNIIQGFKSSYQDIVTSSNDEDFLVKKSKNGLTACTYGVENSIGRKEFFRSPGYKAYFDFVDQEGSIYYEKWSDAMVVTVGLSLLLERKDILFLKQHGWQKGQVAFCPKSCACDPKLNSLPLHLSCTPFWMGLSDSPEMKRRVECKKNGKCTLHLSRPNITIDI